jgi:sulfite reductase (NADPH) flavoprotein alpha-component
MFSENKLKTLLDLVAGASTDELIWMNGYLSGVLQSKQGNANPQAEPGKTIAMPAAASGSGKLTILYGTETGNSKKLATDFATKAKQQKINARVVGMDQYKLADLPKEEFLLAVVSTHGDGEPPAAAQKFYDHIHNNGFKLEKLKYSVLALGDTSYPLFCKTGEDVDVQLNKLGAERIAPMQKCDIDYDEDAASWFSSVLKNLNFTKEATQASTTAIATVAPATPAKKVGKQIYTGTVTKHINLNDRGSNKATWHVEIAADGVQYLCGDSIGIVPENDAQLVTDIIAITNADGNKSLTYKNEKTTVYELLKRKLNIIYLTERLVQQYATITGHSIPAGRADLWDLVKRYPVKNATQFEEILVGLNAMSPRLYTIASAPAAHENEVHITVVKDTYTTDGEPRFGLCSAYIGEFSVGKKLQFFVQPNKRFRLPAADKNIIMVGPGTGIAAFRSFLAERDATAAEGKNWLFFGEQHFASDFLYQTEMQNWFETGVLSKISLAFSRDQQQKIYVQHKLQENAAEVYNWLEQGSYFFVCGKKDPMSQDVEQALLKIIEEQGGKTAEQAKQYLHNLEEQGRYEKDVY